MIDIAAARQLWRDLARSPVTEISQEHLVLMCSAAIIYLDALENLGYGEEAIEEEKRAHPARVHPGLYLVE